MEERGSSMKIEFTQGKDVNQALHEVQVDLRVFTNHIAGLARRMKEHFPEAAAGLEGIAAGMKRYDLGLDGGRVSSKANEELRRLLSVPRFEAHVWAYELTRDPVMAIVLISLLVSIASTATDKTFFDVLIEARDGFAQWRPLGGSPI